MCFVSKKKYRALQGELYAALGEIDKLKLSNSLLDVEVKKYKADAEAYSLDADIEREKNKALEDKIKELLGAIEVVIGEIATIENENKTLRRENVRLNVNYKKEFMAHRKTSATEKQLRSDYATLLRKAYLRDGRKFVKAVKVTKAEGVE